MRCGHRSREVGGCTWFDGDGRWPTVMAETAPLRQRRVARRGRGSSDGAVRRDGGCSPDRPRRRRSTTTTAPAAAADARPERRADHAVPVPTLPPGATFPAHPVTSAAKPAAPKVQCLAAPAPPSTAKNVQTLSGDIDGDGTADSVWLYDLTDGPHLQIRTARGATSAVPLGFGKSVVSLGFAQVDYAPGTADPGVEQEILAVASQPDGTRLVGLYGYVKATGCVDLFKFGSGAPFVYLVSRTGTVSGLRCVSDGRTAHLAGVTATPSTPTAYLTHTVVFGRDDGRSLHPVLSSDGRLNLPHDRPALVADGTVVGCTLTRPIY